MYIVIFQTYFFLFDVDQGGVNVFQDQIRNLVGHNGATNSAAFLTGSLDNRVDGTGTTQTITGTNANAGTATSDGNALINFGNNVLTSVTFDYGNRPGNGTVNSEQFIGLHDIRYGRVPEVNAAWGAIAVCVLAIGVRSRRRTQVS